MRRWTAAIALALLITAGCSGPATKDIRIVAAAPDALFDAPLGVTVVGAPAGRRVTIKASAPDSADFPGLVFGVIAGSPSSVVNPGYPDYSKPAWTLHGRPIPHVTGADAGNPSPALDAAAIIPVERIRGPVFLICGLDDALWGSCGYTPAIVERLGRHLYTELQEPEAGHYVGVPVAGWIETPNAGHGGTQQADALGRLDAWSKLLSYLAAQSTPHAGP